MTLNSTNTERETLFFELAKHQLLPIVEQVAGEAVHTFQISVDQQVQGFPGWAGEKLLPTVTYTTCSGRQEQRTLFVKRLHAEVQEARHYTYLSTQQVPVVHLYGVLYGLQQEEILFLEYLEHIFNVIDEQNEDVRRQFLSMLAQFHTTAIDTAYAAILTRIDPCIHLNNGRAEATLEHLWEQAMQGKLGTKLSQLCQSTRSHLPQLTRYASTVARRVAEMEYTLTNAEFGLGLRPGTDEWRLFDLHSIALRPRFSDLIHLFGPPAGVHTVFGPSWRSNRALAYFYLSSLAEKGGPHLSVDELLSASAILWSAWAFDLEWWLELALTGNVIWTTNRKTGRRHCRQQLHLIISTLVHLSLEDSTSITNH